MTQAEIERLKSEQPDYKHAFVMKDGGAKRMNQTHTTSPFELITKKHKEDGSYVSAEIYIEGMGTYCSKDDSPIYIEFFDGRWVLCVYSDINQDDPTHTIDLTTALESNRKEN